MHDEDVLHLAVDRMYTFTGDGPLKAFADLTINDAVLIKGFRVVDGKKGLFVGMPRQGAKNGKWFDAVKPLTRTMHAEVTRAVLEAYAVKTAGDR